MTTPLNCDCAIAARRAIAKRALRRLFRGKAPCEWRREYADAYNWGPDLGREHVEE
jgi:hypothetical protein